LGAGSGAGAAAESPLTLNLSQAAAPGSGRAKEEALAEAVNGKAYKRSAPASLIEGELGAPLGFLTDPFGGLIVPIPAP